MAIQAPNYLQTKSYSAKRDRRVNGSEITQEGIVRKGDFKLSQRAAGANMSVDVAAGEAWVKGDSSVEQGYYHVVNDATVNLALASANATNPRIDTVVLAVNDSTEVGGADEYKLEVLTGTPTSGATLSNLKGVAAVGATKLVIGYVLVAAAATKVETAAMGGLHLPSNFYGFDGATKAEPYAVAGAPPQYAHGHPTEFVPSVRATRLGSAQSIAHATQTAILFNSTDTWDYDEMHDPAGGAAYAIFCKTPGLYVFHGTGSWTSAPGTYDARGLFINGGEWFMEEDPTAWTYSWSIMARMGYGDYAEHRVQQNSGAADGWVGTLAATWMGP